MSRSHRPKWMGLGVASVVSWIALSFVLAPARSAATVAATIQDHPSLLNQTEGEAISKSTGCLACHRGIEDMHESNVVRLGCIDCHGGDAKAATKECAHVMPQFPDRWPTSANPPKSFALLNQESPEFVRFVNPGDWRVAHRSCGTAGCHEREVSANTKSIMGHSAMVPGSALYNNGSAPNKLYRWGEIYGEDGVAQRAFSSPRATRDDVAQRGVAPFLDPLPRFQITQPGVTFRVLERNNNAASVRGPGTDFRTDAVFLNVVKTKLNDPTMAFLGTNDRPGDYRSSGCTSCHVLYANDRDPKHSAHIAAFGNRGTSASADPAIPRGESGHPIKHQLTRAIPSSQCMTCHFHQGSGAISNYYGVQWWDYETDANEVYPRYGKPGPSGIVGDKVDARQADLAPEVNPHIRHNEFADIQNAGWFFQSVLKRDRQGRLLDAAGQVVAPDAPDWHQRAVHLADVHLDKGMHCVDCHFQQDAHGDGRLYGAMIDAVEISCKDCHGTIRERATLATSNRAGGHNLAGSRTPFGERRFVTRGQRLLQRSSVTPGLEWEVVQIQDVITPGNPHYSEAGRLAKTVQRDGRTWGAVPQDDRHLAHAESSVTCYACHSSWNNNCAGCHLDAKTNLRTETLHYEGGHSKFYAAYNPQVLRSDGFMLGINGTVQGHKVSPVRSASGVVVSAADGKRATVVHEQPTISAEGFNGHAFTPNVPHTVRAKETRRCTDCHLATAGDNNAVVAAVLGLGVGATDFVGRYAWVAERSGGIEAVRVTANEDFPNPVIGSDFHRVLDPTAYQRHVDCGGRLDQAHGHSSRDARSIQRYGEWVFVADGPGGLRVFDIANIANKNVAQPLVESAIGPGGQVLRVPSRCATSVALPSLLPMDPCRTQRPENEEQSVHPIFSYAFVTDYDEGLIVVNTRTLIDGDPANNFLKRAATFNPDGLLSGAVRVRITGTHAYVLSAQTGLVVLDVADPVNPQVVATLGAPAIIDPRSIDIQFRYTFICDAAGLQVIDITSPSRPTPVATVPLRDARDVSVMRTYAYIAAGPDGLAIVNVERPAAPSAPQFFDAAGCMNDATGIVTGASHASFFAYVADGRNGLHVVQLLSPNDGPEVKGFSPVPIPRFIATYPTRGPAVALSKGMPRDRFVDEDGNQMSVFGRRGSRPFNRDEMRRMYLRGDVPFTVSDEPPGPASESAPRESAASQAAER